MSSKAEIQGEDHVLEQGGSGSLELRVSMGVEREDGRQWWES